MSILEKDLIIDFHAYLGKDAFGDYFQTAEQLLVDMDANQIDLAVVAPFTDTPGPDVNCLQKLYEAWKRFPDRLIPFARLDPRYGEEALSELRRAVEILGFRGILFNPLSTQTPASHPGVLPLMELAAKYGIPVLIPTGNGYFGLPEQAAVLSERVPGLRIILGHMGTAPHATRAIDLAAKYENIFIETSLQQSPFRIPMAVQLCGAKKILFGSAAPYGHPYPEKEKILCADLLPQQRSLILGKNAVTMLQLTP